MELSPSPSCYSRSSCSPFSQLSSLSGSVVVVAGQIKQFPQGSASGSFLTQKEKQSLKEEGSFALASSSKIFKYFSLSLARESGELESGCSESMVAARLQQQVASRECAPSSGRRLSLWLRFKLCQGNMLLARHPTTHRSLVGDS